MRFLVGVLDHSMTYKTVTPSRSGARVVLVNFGFLGGRSIVQPGVTLQFFGGRGFRSIKDGE